VKIVDTNVLLYAVDEHSARHSAARTWLDAALSGSESIGFAWSVLLGFVRLSTNRAIAARPLNVDEAIAVTQSWLARPPSLLLEPNAEHLGTLRDLLGPIGTAGNLVADAHLAAHALEYAAEVVSFDADFGRFPGVRWRRPGE